MWRGSRHAKHPCIDLTIAGTAGHPCDLAPTVDTGFSGFLLLPKSLAEPHQLAPIGSTKAKLADGSSCDMPVSLVNVGFAGRTRAGSATIAQKDCHPLVGLDFLRIFELTLVIDNRSLCLLPNGSMLNILYPGPVAP